MVSSFLSSLFLHCAVQIINYHIVCAVVVVDDADDDSDKNDDVAEAFNDMQIGGSISVSNRMQAAGEKEDCFKFKNGMTITGGMPYIPPVPYQTTDDGWRVNLDILVPSGTNSSQLLVDVTEGGKCVILRYRWPDRFLSDDRIEQETGGRQVQYAPAQEKA